METANSLLYETGRREALRQKEKKEFDGKKWNKKNYAEVWKVNIFYNF